MRSTFEITILLTQRKRKSSKSECVASCS
jgi:hypothetical protein